MFKTKTRLYISSQDIQKKCEELGLKITEDYKGKPLVLICVLKGGVVFFSDLVRNIAIPFQVTFVQLSSYGMGTVTSEKIDVIKDLDVNIKGAHVVVVEDILDTGLTLSFYTAKLKEHQPLSVKICTLLDKPSRRRAPIQPDYCGFQIEDHFVVGYGLDYQEICRNYPDIHQV
jgi:hypoxanthine phosphoribosyltransferase